MIRRSCFMSLLELKRGEGLYVGADGPHAWLTLGDSISIVRKLELTPRRNR